MGAILDTLTLRPLLTYWKGKPVADLTGTRPQATEIPPARVILIERRPLTETLRLTYPDGQTELIRVGPNTPVILRQRGIPDHKIERTIDHVWNFYKAYVTCDVDPRPPKMPTFGKDASPV